MRAAKSLAPPAAAVTMRTGFTGYADCAHTEPLTHAASATLDTFHHRFIEMLDRAGGHSAHRAGQKQGDRQAHVQVWWRSAPFWSARARKT
jgi:hypothetical protein